MAFPPGDPHWNSTLEQLRAIRSTDGTTLVPIEFLEILRDVYPTQFSFFMDPREIETIVVHKGRIDEYHQSFLRSFVERAHFACGNAVFCTFSISSKAPAVRRDPDHLNALFELLRLDVGRDVQEVPPQTVPASVRAQLRDFLPRRRRQTQRRYLLASANGFGNLGDDAITAMAEAVIRRADRHAEVTVTRPPPCRALVENADVVVVGAGGLFYDAVFANAVNYTQYLLWAQELGKPACAIGIGTQGIRTELGRRLYREALAGAEIVTVRDENDRAVLRDDVGADTRLEIARDLGFLVEPEAWPMAAKATRPVLLFALADSSKLLAARSLAGYQSTLENCVGDLKERFDVRFFVQSRDDRPLYERLAQTHALEIIDLIGKDAGCALSVYAQADLVLTSRYHGVIFAALAGAPTIPVATDKGKIHQLISRPLASLQPSYIPAQDFSEERLAANLERFFAGTLVPAGREEVEGCRRSAARNVELLKQTVARKVGRWRWWTG